MNSIAVLRPKRTVAQYPMRHLLIGIILLISNTSVLASGNGCHAEATLPAGWSTKVLGDQTVYYLPYNTSRMSIECSLLSKPMTDVEFTAHIGEEEPEESPTLNSFGDFRGRIWVLEKYKGLEWWLTKDRFMVHLIVRSNNGTLPGNTEAEVNNFIQNLKVTKSK